MSPRPARFTPRVSSLTHVLIAQLAILPALLAQGPLAPLNPPAPTMKALDEIEPRINVQRAVNPLPSDGANQYIINTAGSYYLSANIGGVASKAAIQIAADNVTLDLGGFSILNTGGTSGVSVVGPRNNVRIHHGIIVGGTNGISGGSGNGFVVEDVVIDGPSAAGISSAARNGRVEGVTVRGGYTAISLGFSPSLISRCTAYNTNGSNGAAVFVAESVFDSSVNGATNSSAFSVISSTNVTRCTVASCAGSGGGTTSYAINATGIVSDCYVTNCSGTPGFTGISAGSVFNSTVNSCSCTGAATAISGSTLVSGCTVSAFSCTGIMIAINSVGGMARGCTVSGVTQTASGSQSCTAIYALQTEDCQVNTVAGNSSAPALGISGGTRAARCFVTAVTNTGTVGQAFGIALSTTSGLVDSCTVYKTGGDGIYLDASATRAAVTNCVVTNSGISNAGAGGITALGDFQRIDGNTISAGKIGILTGGKSVVVRNLVQNCVTPYSLSATGMNGAINVTTGIIAATVGPWANFQQ